MLYNFCTLFDKNYLTRGLALYYSLRTYCPEFRLWILCMDELTYETLRELQLERVTIIGLTDFEDKHLLKIKPGRSWAEYCWTCTPSLLKYIFQYFPEVDVLSYLDSDLYFYSSPEPVFKEFGLNSIMIIPHRFVPGKTNKGKVVGIYNVSMVSFRRDINGIKCLNWWYEKCLENCSLDYTAGVVGDQKYLDQFPKLFKGVHILKYIGAGVASWNIGQYKVSTQNNTIFINNFPLIFYHFQALEIYRSVPVLSSVPTGCYGDRTIYRQLIYEQYFRKLYEITAKIQRIDPGFSLGFARRPSLYLYLKDMAFDLKQRIDELH